jgi:thymidylate synthase (FAD)
MKVISPSFTIEDEVDGSEMLKSIEKAGRTCYKSEKKSTYRSAVAFVRNIIKNGHESVIEHEKITVRIICDRGVSHELVRHRIASYGQESTRYCNYGKDDDLVFIKPLFLIEGSPQYKVWSETMRLCEKGYLSLLRMEETPQEARSVLPNSLKTEIVMTCNLREWRHFFKLRTGPEAHPQMREITMPMLIKFKDLVPVVFEDIDP